MLVISNLIFAFYKTAIPPFRFMSHKTSFFFIYLTWVSVLMTFKKLMPLVSERFPYAHHIRFLFIHPVLLNSDTVQSLFGSKTMGCIHVPLNIYLKIWVVLMCKICYLIGVVLTPFFWTQKTTWDRIQYYKFICMYLYWQKLIKSQNIIVTTTIKWKIADDAKNV